LPILLHFLYLKLSFALDKNPFITDELQPA